MNHVAFCELIFIFKLLSHFCVWGATECATLGIIRSPRQPATQNFIFDATYNVAHARRRISVALVAGYSRVTVEIWDTQERAQFCMAQLRGIKFK